MRIAVLTDTNSGITVEEAEKHSISLIPMPFFIDGVLYFEGFSLSQAEFF